LFPALPLLLLSLLLPTLLVLPLPLSVDLLVVDVFLEMLPPAVPVVLVLTLVLPPVWLVAVPWTVVLPPVWLVCVVLPLAVDVLDAT
jgi:hypothetical protein